MGYFEQNQVGLSGRCAIKRDTMPELRSTKSGREVCEIRMAFDQWNSSKQEKEGGFINVVFWDKLAAIVARELSPGTPFTVWGELRDASYENRDGVKVQKLCIWAGGFAPTRRKDEGGGGGGNRDYGGGEPGKKYDTDYGGAAGSGGGNAPAYDDFDVGDLGPPLDMDDPAPTFDQ